VRRPPRRRVLDAAQADVGVTAGNRLVDLAKIDVDELGPAAEPARHQRRDLDVEANEIVGSGRIGLDERRAPFGVARPAKDRGLLLAGLAVAGPGGRKRRRKVMCAWRRPFHDDEGDNCTDEGRPGHRSRL